MTPAIVVVAYNRAESLKRLLGSLKNAAYPVGVSVPLIISVDKGDNEDVIDAADGFEWEYGDKQVITHETNLGLKKHVLECGDKAVNYGSAIILEDDLMVSEGFYGYTLQALEFAKEHKSIGGVSLYNHLLNVHSRRPFCAVEDGYDNYYFQFASSWGQAYTGEMWSGFREWLLINDGRSIDGRDMPDNVSGWSDSSWLKYNIRYLIDKNMYFMYPRVSLTTNFMSEGTHSKSATTDLQVPMLYGRGKKYVFSGPEESKAVYDAFFENRCLAQTIAVREGVAAGECMVDLYGQKNYSGEKDIKRLVSSKALPYRVIKSYGISLRPLEANVMYEIPGDEFFLYDTAQKGEMPVKSSGERLLYDNRALKLKDMAGIIKHRIKNGGLRR